MKKRNKKAVLLFSGGQDSTTCLYWAKEVFQEVMCLVLDYEQTHSIEVRRAEEIAEINGVEIEVLKVGILKQLGNSSLLKKGEPYTYENGIPSSYVPNRNQLFITIAHAFAQKLGYGNIVLGVSQEDYSGYPDCREGFIKSIEKASNIGSNKNIGVHAPLIHKNKAETFKMADNFSKLDEVIEKTHTCYRGVREEKHEWGYGCGDCPACKLRKNGYEEFRRAN